MSHVQHGVGIGWAEGLRVPGPEQRHPRITVQQLLASLSNLNLTPNFPPVNATVRENCA